MIKRNNYSPQSLSPAPPVPRALWAREALRTSLFNYKNIITRITMSGKKLMYIKVVGKQARIGAYQSICGGASSNESWWQAYVP